MESLTSKTLTRKHRIARDGLDDNLNVRLHRSLSWLRPAESALDNECWDEAFVYYWISFNAIYSVEQHDRTVRSEKDIFSDFFVTIRGLDDHQTLYDWIWNGLTGSIHTLIKNKYVYRPFWDSLNDPEIDWKSQLEQSVRHFSFAFKRQDTIMILCIIFDRLYVLRNQIIHGNAARNSRRNRAQIRDGVKIMAFLIPVFIDLMIENPEAKWSAPTYPPIT